MRWTPSGSVLVTAMLIAVSQQVLAVQEWRGPGRVAGTVVDQQTGESLPDVTVRAGFGSADGAGTDTTSDADGDWAIAGLAPGHWILVFSKPGYGTVSLPALVQELRPLPAIHVELRKLPGPLDERALAEEQIRWAEQMMGSGQFEMARHVYERLAKSNPGSARLELLIARTYAVQHDTSAALEHLEIAADNSPDRPEARLLASNLLVDAGRVADARRWCDSIDETTLDTPVLRQEYAVLLVKVGEFDRAISRFDDLISAQPNAAEPYFYRALAFHRMHRSTEARRDVEAFLRLAHGDSPFIAQAKALLKQLAGSR
jgi:hypothetical protein